MDFWRWPARRLRPLCTMRRGPEILGPRRHHPAWLLVRVGVYHGANLPQRTGGIVLARPRSGFDVADEQRRRKSARLRRHRLLVPNLFARGFNPLAVVLGVPERGGWRRARLFPPGLSRAQHRISEEAG